jgi:hypothetical protein
MKNQFSQHIASIEKNKLALKSFVLDDNCVRFPEYRVYIKNNQRLLNAFSNGLIDASNFEEKYHLYLDYGLVIFCYPEKLIFYNDIHGCYPLFMYHGTDGTKELRNFYEGKVNFELNQMAVYDFMMFNHFLFEDTLNKNIKRLPGSSKIIVTENKIESHVLKNWDDLVNIIQNFQEENEPTHYLNTALNESFSKQEKILTLTGGFDSRLLFAGMLKNKHSFKTITWGVKDNLQTKVASELSSQYQINHIDMVLNETFESTISEKFEYLLEKTPESPFIIDVPQFIHMCENLPEHCNLVCGFMGSEVLRGPSYSSQVTLTAFAARIGLSENKDQIEALIREFNRQHNVFAPLELEKNISILVDRYAQYSRIGVPSNIKNKNIFKYLFHEKYVKIYSQFIKIHFDHGLNLINPYMDFKFICSAFKLNKALTELTPYENNFFKNFKLYKLYARQIKLTYPALMSSRVDRGYKLNDLVTISGQLKLIPYQAYRTYKKKTKKKVVKTVDSFAWYRPLISNPAELKNSILSEIINEGSIKDRMEKINYISDFQRLQILLYFGLAKSLARNHN